MTHPSKLVISLAVLISTSCSHKKSTYHILGNIEDPQNEIANTIATVLNKQLHEQIVVDPGVGSLANLDSLENDKADFGIVDNYSRYSDKVSSVVPLYSQVLHILYRSVLKPITLMDLLSHRKVFAGLEGSGTRRFVDQLISEYGIGGVEIINVSDFFQADVIFSFTDLLSRDELKDLQEFKLFSLDKIDNLGKGSLAESICTRFPQFAPYVLPKNVYGDFDSEAVLTVKVDAVLVCRSALNVELIYVIIKALQENKQDITNINPLLFSFSGDFDPTRLNLKLHSGARNYLERYQPTLLEKHADLIGVIISIFVGLASALYSISQWQRARKKNKVDVYYKRLIGLRRQIHEIRTISEASTMAELLKSILDETFDLVIEEKLMADSSFLIFLNLSTIVMDDVKLKHLELSKQQAN